MKLNMTGDKKGSAPRADREIVSEWLAEGAAELADANTTEEEVDAASDALGVILVSLTAMPRKKVEAGYRHYCAEQTRRGRSLSNPHQILIRGLVMSIGTLLGAEEVSRAIISRRGGRHDASARREYLAAFIKSASAFKAGRKEDK